MRYGDDTNGCSAVKLQFDAGRGTVMRLAELNISPEQFEVRFFTHMHTDHTEGFADLVTLRWMFFGVGPKIDAVCSSDVGSTFSFSNGPQECACTCRLAYSIHGPGATSLWEFKEHAAAGSGPDEAGSHLGEEPLRRIGVGLLRMLEVSSNIVDAYCWPCVFPSGYACGSVVIGGCWR